jgi:hypothetical protein
MFPIMLGLVAAVIAKSIQERSERRTAGLPPPIPPMQIDPRWRTSDVLGLARGISEDHAYERLPILGDALMDAGCEDEAILRHCHAANTGESWLVSLLLGKG